MNLLISTIAWGDSYFANVVDYSLPSLFASDNIPRALKDGHHVTVLLMMEQAHIEAFRATDLYRTTAALVQYELLPIEHYGFNPTRIPSGHNRKKYQFLSVCQNIIITFSKAFDIHVFNYADFIWADESLPNLVARFADSSIFALTGFSPPVQERDVKHALNVKRGPHGDITLNNYEAVSLALKHLHPEARLRNWENQAISAFPSYLYWEVLSEGILLRAFHQTLFAAAPNRNSAVYNAGIRHGTLDSQFSSDISATEKTAIVDDSASIFVFSMHTSIANTKSNRTNNYETLRQFASRHLTSQHATHFRTPIRFRICANVTDAEWDARIEESRVDTIFVEHCITCNTTTDSALSISANWKKPHKAYASARFFPDHFLPRAHQYARTIFFTFFKR